MNSIRRLYDERLAAGDLYLDADQLSTVQALEKLSQTLVRSDKPGIWQRMHGKNSAENIPQGYYLHGGVGRGKSMVMDLFFNAVNIEKKRTGVP